MSLSDLVPVAVSSDFRPRKYATERERLTANHLRWVAKHRARFNKYRREWYARHKGITQ